MNNELSSCVSQRFYSFKISSLLLIDFQIAKGCRVAPMVLILDGNSVHVAQAWRYDNGDNREGVIMEVIL